MAKATLLFAGTDDGLVLFSNPGGVGRWLRVGHELRGRAIRAVWPLIDNPQIVLAAIAGAGLWRSEDGGQSWRAALDGEVFAVTGQRDMPATLYLGAQTGQVYRSDDAGTSWASYDAGDRTAQAEAGLLIASLSEPRRLYMGYAHGQVWASPDGGENWARYADRLPAPLAALADAPQRLGALYAVAGGALHRCAGAEERWEPLAGVRPGPQAALLGLPGRDEALLVALPEAGGIARSADGGATWAATSAETAWNSPVTALAPAIYHMDTAFAGSASGQIATSTDRGRTWQMLRQDLPPIRCIAAARLA